MLPFSFSIMKPLSARRALVHLILGQGRQMLKMARRRGSETNVSCFGGALDFACEFEAPS